MNTTIRTSVINQIGHIELNRPQALNSLSLEMIRTLTATLTNWKSVPEIKAVLIYSSSERAFCAGGDIRSLWESGRTDGAEACRFFRHEYRLNAAIAELPKPYVALLDGVTMGGGIGVSVHGSHRIVTEHAALAMPETLIGFFPDVGGSILLNNCPGEIGMYLGLTGARLNAADALYARFATHYLPAANLDPLRARLIAGEKLEALLMELTADPGTSSLAQYRATIDRVFAADGVEDICAGLEQEGDWGRATLAQLRARSPFALKLTFAQLRAGRGQSLRTGWCQHRAPRREHGFGGRFHS